VAGEALPSRPIEDASIYFPLRDAALLYEVVGGPNAGKTQTLDLAKVTRQTGGLPGAFNSRRRSPALFARRLAEMTCNIKRSM
jgi:hypothetical protein